MIAKVSASFKIQGLETYHLIFQFKWTFVV